MQRPTDILPIWLSRFAESQLTHFQQFLQNFRSKRRFADLHEPPRQPNTKRLGEQGREHVRENFLITGNLRRYLTLFRLCAGAR